MRYRTIKPWGAVLLAGTLLAFTVTPAQATSPGPDWYVVGQQEFDSWQPTPPGSDWVLVGQQDIDDWQPFPEASGDGHWRMVDVKDRRYFLADSGYRKVLESSVTETIKDSDGVSNRIFGTEEIVSRTPGESGSVIKSPYRSYDRGSYRFVTKLVRYERWEDQDLLKPWLRYYRSKNRTRQQNLYRLEWKDPITNETLKELAPSVEYTDWVYGAPFNDGIESSGEDPGSRRVSLPSEDREEDLYRVSLGVSSLSAANGDRPSNFQGDSASSSRAGLQAAKLREKLGANEVRASEINATAAQIEEARKKAAEEAAKQAAEEAKRNAEEEAKRKAEREEQARKDQERQQADQEADSKPPASDPLSVAIESAKDGFGASRSTVSTAFADKMANLFANFDAFTLDKQTSNELAKHQQAYLKDIADELKDLERDFAKKAKECKDQAAVRKVSQEYAQKLETLKASLVSEKLREANKLVAKELARHVEKGGTMRSGEERNVNGQSVMALYSHDTGRWVLLAFSKKDYKGDVTVLDAGLTPRKSKADTPILSEFMHNGVKLQYLVDYKKGLLGESYDVTVQKK